jgi:uncharacterized protein YebE (UPF0316 family)
MLASLSIPSFWMPFVIFGLRVVDMSLDTLRVLIVIRGRRTLSWVIGFCQSAIWVIAITGVLSNLDNLWNLVAFAVGFATGNVLGMMVEERLAIGHSHLRVISPRRGSAIADAIRREGYAATEVSGRGRDGMVTVIDCSVLRRALRKVERKIYEIDSEAFITVEEIRPIHRGYWRS